MTESTSPKRQLHITGAMMLWTAVAVLSALILIGWATSGDDNHGTPVTPPAATPERLCQLLREGYTPGTLGYNGMWRTWPDAVSGHQRGLDIGVAALEGGCANLL